MAISPFMKSVMRATSNGLSTIEAKVLKDAYRNLNPTGQAEAANDLVRANCHKVFNAVTKGGPAVELESDAFVEGAAKATRRGVTASEAKMLRDGYQMLHPNTKNEALEGMLRGNYADAFNAAASGGIHVRYTHPTAPNQRDVDVSPFLEGAERASGKGLTASETKMLRAAYLEMNDYDREQADEIVLERGYLGIAAAMKGIK